MRCRRSSCVGRSLRAWFAGAALLTHIGTAHAESPRPENPTTPATARPANASHPSQNPEGARRLFEEGLAAARKEHWSEAEALFRQSAEGVERPSTLFNWAIVLLHLDRAREALEIAERWFAIAGANAPDAERQAIDALRVKARARVSTVTVRVSPADATLEVDGRTEHAAGAERSVVLDCGTRRFVVSAPGHQSQSFELTLEPQQVVARRITLERSPPVVQPAAEPPEVPRAPRPKPAPAPPSRTVPEPAREAEPTNTAAYVLLGTGSGLLVAGAVTGVLAVRTMDDVEDACPALENCDRGLEKDYDRARLLAVVTDILIGAGVISLGASWFAFDVGADSGVQEQGAAHVLPTRFGARVRGSW